MINHVIDYISTTTIVDQQNTNKQLILLRFHLNPISLFNHTQITQFIQFRHFPLPN